MKKILLFLLFATAAWGQGNKLTVQWQTNDLLEYFSRNIQNIQDVDGIDWVAIPVEQELDRNLPTVWDGNFPVQYTVENKKVKLKDIPSKMVVFNFKTKKASLVDGKSDKDLWKRPKDEDIIKKIEKALEKSAKTKEKIK